MNLSRKKIILILLCFVFSSNTSKTGLYPTDIIGYLPAVGGAALIAHCAKYIYKSEKEIVQEQVEELQERIEQRRAVVGTIIENLRNELDTLHHKTHHNGNYMSPQEKKILNKLNQAREELRAIDLHYQLEYVCIRSRERHIKLGYAVGTIIGSGWMLMSLFYHTEVRGKW